MKRSTFVVTLTLLLSALLLSCGSKGEKERAQEPSTRAEQRKDSTTNSAQKETEPPTEKIKLKTPDDRQIAEFKFYSDHLKVEIGEEGSARTLRGEMRESGKRKYELDGGQVVAEVKSDTGAFKLRSSEGKLLWKVKLDADKIKISDNEENQNPYELKMMEEKIKIEENGMELGEVKYYADNGKVKVKRASGDEFLQSKTPHQSAAYGVMMMERIPETERYIIAAEILSRGR